MHEIEQWTPLEEWTNVRMRLTGWICSSHQSSGGQCLPPRKVDECIRSGYDDFGCICAEQLPTDLAASSL